MSVDIRLKALELAISVGAKNPVETAAAFLEFLSPREPVEVVTESEVELPASTRPGAAFARRRLKEMAFERGVAASLLLGEGRTAPIVKARHEIIRAFHDQNPNISIADIGRAMGRDHTTILHALRRTEPGSSIQ